MKNEIKIIDFNKDGAIQIQEWVAYILPVSHMQSKGFDFSLRKLFDKYDSDKNGEIQFDELLEILKYILKENMMGLSTKHVETSLEVVEMTAKKIMAQYDADNSKTLDVSLLHSGMNSNSL